VVTESVSSDRPRRDGCRQARSEQCDTQHTAGAYFRGLGSIAPMNHLLFAAVRKVVEKAG
jgi:hypothetical protein